jgi:hypothetical protein
VEAIISVLANNMYVVVVALICLAVVANSLFRAVTEVLTSSAREKSRREIAAYIAEGSLNPDQGERIMKADVGRSART